MLQDIYIYAHDCTYVFWNIFIWMCRWHMPVATACRSRQGKPLWENAIVSKGGWRRRNCSGFVNTKICCTHTYLRIYIYNHIYIYVCVFVWVYNRRVLFVQYCLYVYTHVTMYDCMGIWSGDMWEYFTAMKQEVWWLWWNSKCFLDGSFLIQWLTFPIQNLESKIPQSKLGPIKAANFKIVCSTFDVSMAQTCSNGLDHLDHMKQLRNSLLMPLESRMWFQAILEGTEHPSKSFGLFEASIST